MHDAHPFVLSPLYHNEVVRTAMPCATQPAMLTSTVPARAHALYITCIVYLYCVQCGHRVAHKTCVNDTKKCRTLTAFSLRLCPDMQAASRKIILSHTFIITFCVSGMKKWVSAWFFAYRAKIVAYRPDTHVCTWGEPCCTF